MEHKDQEELKRCIGCKTSPCAKGCPVGVSPHDFIAYALKQDYDTAARLIRSKNPLAETCGLICPDTFCQKNCIRGKIDTPISIPHLQARISHQVPISPLKLPTHNGKHIAIIGGGPSALGCCWQLVQFGYKVTIFEKSSQLGGALRLIPDYRLPKSVLDKEITSIISNQLTTVCLNQEITDFSSLQKDFDCVILALGEQTPHTLQTLGEEFATPYKQILSSPTSYTCSKACVVGGGEVALDCALSLKKSGTDIVEMFVRRRISDMRIMKKDFAELKQHNIIIRELTSITNITKEKDTTLTLKVIKNTINSNNKATPLANTDNTLSKYDLVVTALGSCCSYTKNSSHLPTIGDMTGRCGTAVEALASGIKLAHTLHSDLDTRQ